MKYEAKIEFLKITHKTGKISGCNVFKKVLNKETFYDSCEKKIISDPNVINMKFRNAIMMNI